MKASRCKPVKAWRPITMAATGNSSYIRVSYVEPLFTKMGLRGKMRHYAPWLPTGFATWLIPTTVEGNIGLRPLFFQMLSGNVSLKYVVRNIGLKKTHSRTSVSRKLRRDRRCSALRARKSRAARAIAAAIGGCLAVQSLMRCWPRQLYSLARFTCNFSYM